MYLLTNNFLSEFLNGMGSSNQNRLLKLSPVIIALITFVERLGVLKLAENSHATVVMRLVKSCVVRLYKELFS